MKRREFIAGLGGAAAWPLAARAQQSAVPVVGYLAFGTLETTLPHVTGFRRGLSEVGFLEGRNLAVEYRWADYRVDRLAPLAVDLVDHKVAVIVTPSTPPLLAAKAATQSIPIVFTIGLDPVEIGVVKSLNRPGGNITGIASYGINLTAKRLELLHESVPAATLLAFLINPATPAIVQSDIKEAQAAARALGVRLVIVNARDPSELDAAFAALVHEGVGALLVSGDALFTNYPDQLAALAARYGVPVMYTTREHAKAGGLMSYGTDIPDLFRQIGVYTGRILKGEKPADLPVQQVTTLELVINMKTARTLGLRFPLPLLARANEVIE